MISLQWTESNNPPKWYKEGYLEVLFTLEHLALGLLEFRLLVLNRERQQLTCACI